MAMGSRKKKDVGCWNFGIQVLRNWDRIKKDIKINRTIYIKKMMNMTFRYVIIPS